MAEQAGDKKHEATPHRRDQARRKGQVARSQDLVSVSLLFAGISILLALGEYGAGYLTQFSERILTERPAVAADDTFLRAIGLQVIAVLALVLLPLMGALMLVAVLVNLGQTGFMLLPSRLNPDLSRIDPIKGFGRLFSLQNIVRVGFGLAKTAVVAIVAAVAPWQERDRLLSVGDLSVIQLAGYLTEVTLWTSLKIAAVLLILALADYLFQWWKLEQDLRMTDQEFFDELKENQGDPKLKGRRRELQREIVNSRLRQAVPASDAVVSNPTELAVAIRYDPKTMIAPIVSAKGAGSMAQRIRRLALENGVPIVERKELAQLLYAEVEVDHPVPMKHYAAVAEVLRYVYELKGESPFDEARRAAS